MLHCHFKKRDIKYIIVLLILAILTVTGLIEGIKDYKEYNEHTKNAVSVIATVQESVLQYREEVNWNAGAGDDIDKEIVKTPYYVYKLKYSFAGKEYGFSTSDYKYGGADGEQVKLIIDATNPEHVIMENHSGKANFYLCGMFFVLFITILLVWLIRKSKRHK